MTKTRRVLAGAVLLSILHSFCACPPAWADPLTLLVGHCLGTLEELTGAPAWRLEGSGLAQLVRECEGAPYRTLVKIKGVGNVFTPMNDLRGRETRPAPEAPKNRKK